MFERPRSRAAAAVVAGFALAAAGAGCAQIPTSGSVTTGRLVSSGSGVDQPPVGLIAALPARGMSRGRIVEGFLRAQAVSNGGASVARAFLTQPAAAHWHPSATISVYDDTRDHLAVSGHEARFTADRVGTISGAGRWVSARGTLSATFRLKRADGQWRISGAPRQTLLGTTDLLDLYDVNRLEFISARTGDGVAVPVVEPQSEPGLATALVEALLAGPPRQLGSAVTTAFPRGAALAGNVTVDDSGVAAVNLTAQVGRLVPGKVRTAMDQLLVTLGQVPGVRAVRLLSDNTPLSVPGVPDERPVTAGQEITPPQVARQLTALTADGKAVRVSSAVIAGSQSAPGATIGRRWPALDAISLSDAGRVVAVTSAPKHRARLLLGSLDGRLHAVARVESVESVQWAGEEAVAVVDGTRLAVVRGGRLRRIGLPAWVVRAGVHAATVAPDGTTVALAAGPPGKSRLVVGALTTDHRVTGLHRIAPTLRDISAPAWGAQDSILALTPASDGKQELVSVDPAGFAVRSTPLPRRLSAASQVCAVPGEPTALIAGGRLWLNRSGRWIGMGLAVGCSYGG